MAVISTICLTYNHFNFIADSIHGFALQNLSEKTEFLIFDDASTDGTTLKIKEIIKDAPQGFEIKVIINDQNIGLHGNFINSLKSVKSDYIAICEGDDFWIDSNKLKLQKDFLDLNPDYSFCCTNIEVINDFGEKIPGAWPNKNKSFTLTKRALGTSLPVPTCSLFFRTSAISGDNSFFHELNNSPWPDFFLTSWLLTIGKGCFFEQKMAVYRQHGGGIYTSSNSATRLAKSKVTRRRILIFCLKRLKLFSALICFKNMLKYPQF